MIPKAIKESYSCKRRKDFVTGFAIIFFCLVVCFELYVVIWMPVMLQQKNMLATHVERERLLRNFDNMRSICRNMYEKNRGFHKGEILLTLRVLDLYAIYLRNEAENMDMKEIISLQKTLGRFESFIASWQKGKYHFRKLEFDMSPGIRVLEKKTGY